MLLLFALVVCLLALGLLALRLLLNKNAEPGTSLRLTDLLMMGSACWAQGTRADLEWRRELERKRAPARASSSDWSAARKSLSGAG
jgi:hypothetical protein